MRASYHGPRPPGATLLRAWQKQQKALGLLRQGDGAGYPPVREGDRALPQWARPIVSRRPGRKVRGRTHSVRPASTSRQTREGRKDRGMRCSPHVFRHTFAIEFLRAGGNVFTLKELLGHTSLTISNRYVALADADIERQHRLFSPVEAITNARRREAGCRQNLTCRDAECYSDGALSSYCFSACETYCFHSRNRLSQPKTKTGLGR